MILPKFAKYLLDFSLDHEKYEGYWNYLGLHKSDPAGSDLRQLRMNLGSAFRLHDNIQSFAVIPYIININQYTGIKSNTYGAGDITIGVNFEAFDDIRCVYRVLSFNDIIPAAYFGLKLTIPTGLSPYDKVENSFDITGLGFYTASFTVLLDKTIKSYNFTLSGSYSINAERPVNREYGRYVEPYSVQPGGKLNFSASTGYTFAFDSMDSLTFTLGYSYIMESLWKINNVENVFSGFYKHALSAGLAFSSADQNHIIKIMNTINLPLTGWGMNKPTSYTTTLEYSYVIR